MRCCSRHLYSADYFFGGWFRCRSHHLYSADHLFGGWFRCRSRDCRRSVTQLWSQPKILTQGFVSFKEKLKRLNGYPKPFPMMVHLPTVGRWPPRGGLDLEFPSSRTPTHDRQGLVLSGRYARQFVPLLFFWFAANLCMCTLAHTCTYTCIRIYIYMHTHLHIHIHTCSHIHRPSSYPSPADAPHSKCQLPPQTLKLKQCKSSLKLRIFQHLCYQNQVLGCCTSYAFGEHKKQ